MITDKKKIIIVKPKHLSAKSKITIVQSLMILIVKLSWDP